MAKLIAYEVSKIFGDGKDEDEPEMPRKTEWVDENATQWQDEVV